MFLCGPNLYIYSLFRSLLLTIIKMKRNVYLGMFLIGAIALSSCSTQNKLASAKANDDDVYFTKAKAAEAPAVTAQAPATDNYRRNSYSNTDPNSQTYDDYYMYDSYEARLNRFYGYSPFLNYNDVWYGASPYYTGLTLGLSFGSGYYGGMYGYGYSPYYSPYYGYGPFGYTYGYGGYGGYGIPYSYAYGASPYWGTYSYYGTVPYNGIPRPGGTGVSLGRRSPIYYGGATTPANPTTRPVRSSSTNPSGTVTGPTYTRPTTTTTQQPTYTPPPRPTYTAPQSYPSSSGSSSSGSSSGGGGGSRPVRP